MSVHRVTAFGEALEKPNACRWTGGTGWRIARRNERLVGTAVARVNSASSAQITVANAKKKSGQRKRNRERTASSPRIHHCSALSNGVCQRLLASPHRFQTDTESVQRPPTICHECGRQRSQPSVINDSRRSTVNGGKFES